MILNNPYPESMKRIVALLLIWSMSANILFAVPLRRGTSVIVRLSTSANSNRDTPIRAEVVSDLTIAGELIITRGTPVILSVNKRKAGVPRVIMSSPAMVKSLTTAGELIITR